MPAMILPRVVPVDVESYDNMIQKIQFVCPDESVRDILWDSEHERIIILDNDNYPFTINCEDTGIVPSELTLRQVLLTLGFRLDEYIIENKRCIEPTDNFDNLVDTDIKTQNGCQFKLVYLY